MPPRGVSLAALLLVACLLSRSACAWFGWAQRRDEPNRRDDAGAQATTRAAQLATDAVLDTGPAGVALAARQSMLAYATSVAFSILNQKLRGQNVPDVSKTFSIPIVGSFELALTQIVITNFTCEASSANLTILGDGFFHLLASDIGANLTFQWHWKKGGLSGTGDGELLLQGGSIDYVFDVHKDETLQKPQLQVVTANCNFDTVDLRIHSYTADWLYQAVLTLFNEVIKRQVQNGVAAALNNDVPTRLNAVLASLPTRIDVKGLPFDVAFDYSIYTTSFVLVKGYAEVEVPESPSAAAGWAGQQQQQQQQRQRQRQQAGAAGAWAMRRQLRSAASAVAEPAAVAQMEACPFETSPLPLTGVEIGEDAHMVSVYVHEATANCLLWGLFRSGKLTFSLKEGSIPGVSITTDVLALLVPELPTLYPHQLLTINVEALDAPHVAFTAALGATVSAFYRMALVVANDTLGNPEVVRLAANLTVSLTFDWDTVTVGDVVAHHEVEASALQVPAERWDNTVTWLLQNYGSFVSLRQLVSLVVKTPIASMAQLTTTQAATWDRWYGLSADVEVTLPGPPSLTM